MSLQVWLPLNGSLENKGLSDIVATPSGSASIDNNGKVGKCYKFGSSAGAIQLTETPIKQFSSNFSFSLWVNISAWGTSYDTYLYCGKGDSPWASYIFGLLRNGTNSNIVFVISNGTTATNNSLYSSTLALNTWYHITCTYETGKMKIYLNGVLDKELSTTIIPDYSLIQKCFIGALNASGAYQTQSKINDVRIYDHCLSEKEVKEISKGLALHYKLDDGYVESTSNLCTSGTLSSSCYNGATSKYNYGTSTDIYKTTGFFEGRDCTKVYMGTAGLAAYPYVFFDNLHPSQNNYKTLSFDYFPTSQTSLVFYTYGGTATASYTINGSNSIVGSTIPVELNKWNHITLTLLGTSTSTSGWGYVRIGTGTHTSTTTEYWLFSNIQIEEKDHATPYTPTSRTGNIVYDNSGYGYNGTISGSLTTSSESARYLGSTYLNSTTTISHTNCLDNSNQEWTCCAWVKPDAAGGYQNLNSMNQGNRIYHGTYPLLYLNSGTNDYYNYGNLALPASQWSHIAFVFRNSDLTKNIYVNGVLHTNTGGPKSGVPSGLTNTIVIGSAYSGYISDYREYATALSESDIKELYETSASIDKNGNLYCRELVEV